MFKSEELRGYINDEYTAYAALWAEIMQYKQDDPFDKRSIYSDMCSDFRETLDFCLNTLIDWKYLMEHETDLISTDNMKLANENNCDYRFLWDAPDNEIDNLSIPYALILQLRYGLTDCKVMSFSEIASFINNNHGYEKYSSKIEDMDKEPEQITCTGKMVKAWCKRAIELLRHPYYTNILRNGLSAYMVTTLCGGFGRAYHNIAGQLLSVTDHRRYIVAEKVGKKKGYYL